MERELEAGDRVRIRRGAFAHFPATVESVSDDGLLVRVVVEILGRATPLDLQYWEVEKIKRVRPPLSSDN
jgi:transcriptional antiterminator NusG